MLKHYLGSKGRNNLKLNSMNWYSTVRIRIPKTGLSLSVSLRTVSSLEIL